MLQTVAILALTALCVFATPSSALKADHYAKLTVNNTSPKIDAAVSRLTTIKSMYAFEGFVYDLEVRIFLL